MQVEQTLWTVERNDVGHDEGLQLAGIATQLPSDAANACSPLAAELARLQASARGLESIVTAQGSRIPPGVIAESFARWRQKLATSQSRLLKMQEEAIEPADIAVEIKKAEDVAERVRQRLVQSGVLNEDETANQRGAAMDAVESSSAVHFLSRANAGELHLTWQMPATNRLTSRTAVACVLAALSFLLGFVLRSALVREWLMSHGAFVIGALGVGWWLLAPLGWLGWIPVLAAVWCCVRSPWPMSQFDGASTIQRWPGSQAG
jgi:hypothetical protein